MQKKRSNKPRLTQRGSEVLYSAASAQFRCQMEVINAMVLRLYSWGRTAVSFVQDAEWI